jgi:hypothetical protein
MPLATKGSRRRLRKYKKTGDRDRSPELANKEWVKTQQQLLRR